MAQTKTQFSTLSAKKKLPASIYYNKRFLFNRELSWLEFNRRVLEEALDKSKPLLERLKFLSIFSTNLDEFFMIRVSGLKEQVLQGIEELSPDGMTATEQLKEIRQKLLPMLAEQSRCLHEEILPALEKQGIRIEPYSSLKKSEKEFLNEYFLSQVFPILTPQAVDASHPFPYISNLSLNLGLMVEPTKNLAPRQIQHLFTQRRFARIKIPPSVPRLIAVEEGKRFVLLEELIAANLPLLFPNVETEECYLFRVTRDADIEIREDEAGDLLRTVERELHRRRLSFPVRLEVEAEMPEEMISYLTKSFGLSQTDVYKIEGLLNIPDLMLLYNLNRPDLKDKPINYSIPKVLRKTTKNYFDILKSQDVLLHHPFTSYSVVTDFIDAAAEDDDVLAIKICLYRTGKDAPIIRSLVDAVENGKQVAALIELKARFDEENNIEWARHLESEGVHVIYGIRGLKIHSKVALVVRREDNQLRRYVHIATGNYNPTTSKIYTDIGLLTSDEEIGADVTNLFNFLTGYSYQYDYRRLLVSPINLRQKTLELIKRETKNAKEGKPARIIAKMNSLTDVEIIYHLYEASQAGVQIDLIVRGICMLRPGLEGISDRIRVISIVGRFLEHSRIFYFENAGESEVYIGSADWMKRNLDHRVEVVVPIKDEDLRDELKEILEIYLRDTAQARVLLPDGSYERLREKAPSSEWFSAQDFFAKRGF
ncbi:MAG: polyphosphate kinase 1 [Acidobacteria bacterium]|jgi:polyphosphate kinase|nr:MAG: polyphosphate kinase 1 [Acidobacteriota bacterium]GIU81050.1 MAG: polyphosphate kinase [Pyrinomonadaceae bacterium]